VLVALLVAAVMATGCVSMASGGAVQSYPITQGQDAQDQPYLQFQPSPPGPGWSPKQIIEGFLTASASLGDNGQVASEYLTPQESKAWKRSWSATVYQNGPNVSDPVYQYTQVAATPSAKSGGKGGAKTVREPTKATVTISGSVQAELSGYGSYAVPSAQNGADGPAAVPTFTLVKVGTEWRISQAWGTLLLTSDSFKNDYQLRNLYFFDPTRQYLVPDPVYVPVYVPVQSTPTALMNVLVHDLINPPHDWLWNGAATSTAFPPGTTLASEVTLEGVTAVVNLGGSIAKLADKNTVLRQISGQLLATLAATGQSGQTVQTVQVELNGNPWPLEGDPVQPPPFQPPTGATPAFYYLDGGGNLVRKNGLQAKAQLLGHLGIQYTQLAISPDGRYVAALDGGNLYTGTAGGTLGRRPGGGYLSISWDPHDGLWASTNDQILIVPGASPRTQAPQPVSVVNSDRSSDVSGPFTAIAAAPDGVRIALGVGAGQLRFGAISRQQGQITLSPFSVSVPPSATYFAAVAWYGADDVITLAEPGPTVTEYPVNGGTAISIPRDAQMKTISASKGYPLLAAEADNQIAADVSLSGSWAPVAAGSSPVYPG
jgi:hypothetical protein